LKKKKIIYIVFSFFLGIKRRIVEYGVRSLNDEALGHLVLWLSYYWLIFESKERKVLLEGVFGKRENEGFFAYSCPTY